MMQPFRPVQRRRGFSLLELAAMIFVLGLLLTMIAGLVWATVRIERAEAESFQRSITVGSLADEFRADVAAAEAAPEQLDRHVAGRHCLILQKKDGAVIYRWTGGRLERSEKTRGEVAMQALTVPTQTTSVEFSRVKDKLGLVEIALRSEGPPTPGNRPVQIQAALGGGVR